MKTNSRILLLTALFAFLLVSSCKKDDSTKIDESKVLVEYLESANSPLMKDFVNTDMPTIIAASEVKTLNTTNQVYIIDIRAAADFAAGHIANAHNVAVADVLTHIKTVNLTAYTKVAIVCYTGQTAGYVASLIRLMGYDKAYSMKWGMCAWNTTFAGKWNTAIASGNTYASQFVIDSTAKNAISHQLPGLITGKTTGQEILEARVSALLAEGFTPASVSGATLFGSLSTYYIVNYWPLSQYIDPALGHIPGATQYTPKSAIKLSTFLTSLPTDKTVAVYCYTGQTSAFLTAYLRLLGYDAKSVLYGTNGMIYDRMVAKTGMSVFNSAQIMGYDYVTGAK